MLNIFKRKLKPVAEGYLPEEDGHKVYYARYGNIKGKTVISFHGGPGGSTKPNHASCCDLKKYNVIIFDQRGCGKSLPLGKLKNNTTQKTLSDAKRLLDMFGVKRAVIKGSSWGATLALLFAEEYPKMAEKIIIMNIFLGTKKEDGWMFNDTKALYPDLHEKLIKDMPKNKSIFEYYYELITSKNKADIKKGMENFSKYECSLGEVDINKIEVDFNYLESTKLFLYYIVKSYFLKDDQVLKNIKDIINKPCLIVHNRLDLMCPLSEAWKLNKAMKKSKLIIKPALGHGCKLMEGLDEDIAEFLDK